MTNEKKYINKITTQEYYTILKDMLKEDNKTKKPQTKPIVNTKNDTEKKVDL